MGSILSKKRFQLLRRLGQARDCCCAVDRLQKSQSCAGLRIRLTCRDTSGMPTIFRQDNGVRLSAGPALRSCGQRFFPRPLVNHAKAPSLATNWRLPWVASTKIQQPPEPPCTARSRRAERACRPLRGGRNDQEGRHRARNQRNARQPENGLARLISPGGWLRGIPALSPAAQQKAPAT